MTDLRKAAEMALEALEEQWEEHEAIDALRQALAQHVDAVNISAERVDETVKSEHEPFIYIREDTEQPFGGYEHCGQHDAGAFPVYLAPPKREWVGLTDHEARKFYEKYTNREELIYAIDEFLEEKNG